MTTYHDVQWRNTFCCIPSLSPESRVSGPVKKLKRSIITLVGWSCCLVLFEPASAIAAPAMPAILGCSAEQHLALRDMYVEVYDAVVKADRFIDDMMKKSRGVRERLWNHDASPLPGKYFGVYDDGRAAVVQGALQKARERLDGVGAVKIRRLRCGRPLVDARLDETVDKCAADPAGYHFPVGVIVTCSHFWNPSSTPLKTLAHEVFHWLSVKGRYIVDYHGDGVGGHPDMKYYWSKPVDGQVAYRYLAMHAPKWAVYTNDNYALFVMEFASCSNKPLC